MDNLLHSDVTGEILKAFYKVYNDLGYGFLEKVYENSMAFELQTNGLFVQQQLPINVFYNGKIAGEYFADLIVENKVIIEIKTASSIDKAHEAQLLNYLKATEIEVGLVLNFGQKPEKIRKVFTNKRRSLVESLFDES
jgi:GxxExxY protein